MLDASRRSSTGNGIREAAKEAFAHVDGSQRVRSALLRKSAPSRGPFIAGDLVCFFRKDKGRNSASGGRWVGPARVLGTEGRSLVWLIHGGVPITASIETLRRATGGEALAKRELELRPSRKRRRDVLEDDGSQDYPFGDDLVGSPTGAGGLGEPQQLPFFNADDEELTTLRMMCLDKPLRRQQRRQRRLLDHDLDWRGSCHLCLLFLELMASFCLLYMAHLRESYHLCLKETTRPTTT